LKNVVSENSEIRIVTPLKSDIFFRLMVSETPDIDHIFDPRVKFG